MKIATGIRQTPTGFEAYVRVNGRLRTKRFKPDTPRLEMVRWRELQRVAAHYQLDTPLTQGRHAFADDVTAYLALVAGMPTITDRTYRMQQWAAVFGARDRHAIAALEIRAQLERWRVHGHVDGIHGLSPASLNQRRTAANSSRYSAASFHGSSTPSATATPKASSITRSITRRLSGSFGNSP